MYLEHNLPFIKKIGCNKSLFLLFSLLVVATASPIYTLSDSTTHNDNFDYQLDHTNFPSFIFSELTNNLQLFPEASAITNFWSLQNSTVSVTLNDVFFFNSTRGWVVGQSEDDSKPVILHTTSGGVDSDGVSGWTEQESCGTNGANLFAVHFVDSDIGFVGGDSGTFCYTEDGGSTWVAQSLPDFGSNREIYTIYFINSTHGLLSGQINSLNTNLRTIDGGETWTRTGTSSTSIKSSIYFADDNNGWEVGERNRVGRTTDGGVTWTALNSGDGTGISRTWNDVYFTDDRNGWIVSNGTTVRVTTNGGTTWSIQNVGSASGSFNAIDFVDSEIGWLVTSSGSIYSTLNGGSSHWQRQDNQNPDDPGVLNPITSESFNGLHFSDPGNGWAVGDNGVIAYGSDVTIPALADPDDAPKLDLNTGTLSIVYDDFIDHASTTLSGITITDSGGANGVSLDGASLSISPSKTFMITLSLDQKVDISRLADGSAIPLQIDITATAIKDLGGNSPAAISNVDLDVTEDTTGPVLVDPLPEYDLSVDILTLVFDEIVDVSAIDLNGDNLSGCKGMMIFNLDPDTNQPDTIIPLEDATLSITDSSIVTMELSNAQDTSLENLVNLGNTIYIGTDECSDIRDLGGNESEVLDNVELTIIIDGVPPILNAAEFSFAGTLIHFTFRESIDYLAIDLSKITITDKNGENGFSLLGAMSFANQNGVNINIGLNPAQIQQAIILQYGDNAPIRLVIDTGAFRDVNGNLIERVENRGFGTITANTIPPLLDDDTPNINITTGIVYFDFNEYIDVSEIDLSGITITDTNGDGGVSLDGATASTIDFDVITITVTADQLQDIIALNAGANTPIKINVANSAIENLSGVSFGGINLATLTILDSTPPMLSVDMPVLDLNVATLSFDFDEPIEVSEINLSEITITDSNGDNAVSLDNAMLPDTNSNSVIITLTKSQRQEIVVLNVDMNRPVQINVTATAINDLNRNYFVDVDNLVLKIIPDTTAPELLETPSLDLINGTMTFIFNEYIDVSEIKLAGISVVDNAGTNSISLDDAMLPDPDSDSGTVTITLPLALKEELIRFYNNSGPSVLLNVTATAISDLTENYFVIADNTALSINIDRSAPVLNNRPSLDLGSNILTFDFDKTIDVSEIDLSEITITDMEGKNGFSLKGATSPVSDSNDVKIDLTIAQKHSIGTITNGGSSPDSARIHISSDAITDIRINKFEGLVNGSLRLIQDRMSPVLEEIPYIGLLTGVMSFEFDDIIDVSAIDFSGITITDSAGTNGVELTNDMLTDATLSTDDPTIFTISLTELDRQAITLLHYDDDAFIQIDISPNAIKDIFGNGIAAITGDPLTINTDLPLDTWVSQTSALLTSAILSDVYFIDSDNGWAVGSDGTIIATDDGGTTWINQPSPDSTDLYGVHFINSTHGWVVGKSGLILTTDNGGIKWNYQEQIETYPTLNSVHFVDQNNGWAAGDGGTVLATSDGGVTWVLQTSNSVSILNDIHFIDQNNGWAAGDADTVLATINGGTTWAPQTIGTTNVNLSSIHFLNQNNGWAAGDADTVLATINGGTTWAPQTIGTTNVNLSSIHFIDSNNGWTVGDGGVILATDNGGTTWAPQTSGTTENLLNVHLPDPQNAWAVGDNGVILHGFPFVAKPPLLIKAEPTLDLDGSTLSINFDKTINVSAIKLSEISFTDSNGDNIVTLAQANPYNTDSATITISLTESQRQDLVVLNRGANMPVQIVISAAAIPDTNGNNFSGFVDASLNIMSDVTNPKLDNPIPELDLSVSTLSFDFNEYIDVSEIILDKIIITDSTGANGISLGGATLPETDSDAFEITLTSEQNNGLLNLSRGNNTALRIDIDTDTISDLSGNYFVPNNVGELKVTLPSISGGGDGDPSSPPSFTISFDPGTPTIMINNVGIAPHLFKTDYIQSKLIQMLTNKPIPFSFTLYDNESWESVTHIELCMNKLISNNLICDSDTQIIWDKNNYNGSLEIIDPNGVIDSAEFNIVEFSSNVATFNFDIIFEDPVNTTDLQIYVWDSNRDSLSFTVRNAFVVLTNGDSSLQNDNQQSLGSDSDSDSDTRRTDNSKNNDNNIDVNVLNENKSCTHGKLLLDDGTCMDSEPRTFTCLPDQIMHSDNTCKNVPISPTSSVKSPDLQSNQKMIAAMWAGYHSDSATDAQLLNAFDIKPTVLPTWVKSNLGSWVAQDKITLAEFESALQYVNNPQINS